VSKKSADAAFVTIGAAAGGGCVGVAVLATVIVIVLRKRRASAHTSEVKTLASVTSPSSPSQSSPSAELCQAEPVSASKPHRRKKRDTNAFALKDNEGPQVITTTLDDEEPVAEVVVDAVEPSDVRLTTPWPGKAANSKAPRRKKIKKLRKKSNKSAGNDGSLVTEEEAQDAESDEHQPSPQRKSILPDEAM
jgi:hypothetical protein